MLQIAFTVYIVYLAMIVMYLAMIVVSLVCLIWPDKIQKLELKSLGDIKNTTNKIPSKLRRLDLFLRQSTYKVTRIK